MTRKNKVDDLLTRFERKPINQKSVRIVIMESKVSSSL